MEMGKEMNIKWKKKKKDLSASATCLNQIFGSPFQ